MDGVGEGARGYGEVSERELVMIGRRYIRQSNPGFMAGGDGICERLLTILCCLSADVVRDYSSGSKEGHIPKNWRDNDGIRTQ